jgi:ribosomal protein L11 methyltransferase
MVEADLERSLRQLFEPQDPPRMAISTLENRNWNEEWEQSIRPIKVSERVVIRPSWQDYHPSPGEMVITIDPKMSFGTGYHESTRLVIRMMERHLRPDDRVLDIGTGTGILAIAAVALGAASAVGVDTDEWAYTNARENVLGNGTANISIVQGSIESIGESVFTLILANIQRSIILDLLPEIGRRLASGGIALFSGLLASDGNDVANELTKNRFMILETIQENGWIGIAASKQIDEQE